MSIAISAGFSFFLPQSVDVLLQFEAAAIPEQRILSSSTRLPPASHVARVRAGDGIGQRVLLRLEGECRVEHAAHVEVQRQGAELASLAALAPHDLPAEAIGYLFDSRYCPADRFQPFVAEEFPGLSGGALVEAMRGWIADKFTYEPGSSHGDTTALDSFVDRRGVCRDYAHVLITMARAAAIPARYVSCFAPEVEPQDFHAVAEVFLADPAWPGGGIWQLVDATGMADPARTVKIGVGRDAAEVSFFTAFGEAAFGALEVSVQEIA